jgi:hypothetical protein
MLDRTAANRDWTLPRVWCSLISGGSLCFVIGAIPILAARVERMRYRFAPQARSYNVPTMARHVSSLSLSGSRSLGPLDHFDLQFLAFQFDCL